MSDSEGKCHQHLNAAIDAARDLGDEEVIKALCTAKALLMLRGKPAPEK